MDEKMLGIIAIVFSLVVGIALIVLYKKKIVDGELIEGASALLHQIEIPESGSVFSMILKYSKTAVMTVEQLVKNGIINKDDESRKSTAMKIVETAADVDGVPYGAAEMEIASACIEATVAELPRNQKKTDA